MATLGEAIGRAARRLADADVAEPRAEARRLAALATGKAPEQLLSARDELLGEEAERRFEAVVDRRAAHEPFAYISGEREFWSLPFRVTPATLVPRPDTETVVEAALGYARERRMTSPRILDLGTGTGCIALALLSELRDATAFATDISDDALRVAETNARALGFADRIVFRRVAWTDGIDETFDLIVSNPPYIRDGDAATLARDVVDYEPRTALFAGADGLDAYRAIAAGAPSHLKRGGALVLEVGAGQSDDVSQLLRGVGLDIKDVRSDLSGIARCVIATWPGN
ncbi:MAG TPA: peptide chain release factor N(5)-glutamine methyltransferase [Alphaproteobacteria bacterium]|nr:peptide chain release factor N(5)-glutamine methyltransferase [Alphaproteobacteria bacterium]